MIRKEIYVAAIVEMAMKYCVIEDANLREAFKLGAKTAAEIAAQGRAA